MRGAALLEDLFLVLRSWLQASPRPIVLVIDEVDSATNNQVFLDFLAQLRLQYLSREENPAYPAFRSVILAGVTDVRHLKAKIRPTDQSKVNSPWNIAAEFLVDMSFSQSDVEGMLAGYEADHATGMDVGAVAAELVAWTGGYPFLVSRICQLVDEGDLPWDVAGVDVAVRLLLSERNTLFGSLAGKLEVYPTLDSTLRRILMDGERIPYAPDQDDIAQLEMYGFVTRGSNNAVCIANRIFETRLYDLFVVEDKLAGSPMYTAGDLGRSKFVRGGRLDMHAVLEGFRHAYVEVFGPPEEGEEQLRGYLERFGLGVGYLLSFNFNQSKEPGLSRVVVGDSVLWEETV